MKFSCEIHFAPVNHIGFTTGCSVPSSRGWGVRGLWAAAVDGSNSSRAGRRSAAGAPQPRSGFVHPSLTPPLRPTDRPRPAPPHLLRSDPPRSDGSGVLTSPGEPLRLYQAQPADRRTCVVRYACGSHITARLWCLGVEGA